MIVVIFRLFDCCNSGSYLLQRTKPHLSTQHDRGFRTISTFGRSIMSMFRYEADLVNQSILVRRID
jgi:hypothetical protein